MSVHDAPIPVFTIGRFPQAETNHLMTLELANMFGDVLDREVRKHFDRCWKAMWRDLDYLASKNDERLRSAERNGWTVDRLRVVSVLSAFNRIVVGPLAAAYGTGTRLGLGDAIPINYGEHVEISAKTAAQVKPALAAFDQLVASAALKARWLNISRTADLVWVMGRDVDTVDDGDTETDE